MTDAAKSDIERARADLARMEREKHMMNRLGAQVVRRDPTVLAMLTIVDAVASLECCCPTHGGVVTHGSERHARGGLDDAVEFPTCPACDGCPDCLSGQARRIIVRLGGA